MSKPDEPILEVDGLKKHFPVGQVGLIEQLLNLDEYVKAVDGVSLSIKERETLAVVGESGCGKSTLGRTIVQLETPTEGSLRFHGEDVTDFSKSRTRSDLRRKVQMVFQEPQESLNRRKRVGQIIGGPLSYHDLATGDEKHERVRTLMDEVGLPQETYDRYPNQLSGGQQQRVDIARALSVEPELVVLDEPVTALDVSVQAQILNLLMDLQDEFGFSYLLISHDLSVVRHIADRVAVMYLGEIVEIGKTADIFDDPKHPYTQVLLEALPSVDPEDEGSRIVAEGEPPTPIHPPSGCTFHTRCPKIIAPDDLDITDQQWDEVVRFRRMVKTDFATVGDDREIRERMESPDRFVDETFGGIPTDLHETLTTICNQVTDGEMQAAEETLDDAIESPCERVEPELQAITDGRKVHCHLYDEDTA